jgi:SAM-dependent methyltransferase
VTSFNYHIMVRCVTGGGAVNVHDSVGQYPFLKERRGIWREIVRYIRRDAPRADSVVELGAGYCDFINQFPASKKIAFELNPSMKEHAGPDVDFRNSDASLVEGVADGSVDLVFSSNFLEHLELPAIDRLLGNVRRVLKPGGRLILLQPNHRLCGERYFEDPTHITIFSDGNIGGVLTRAGFRVNKIVPDLLPFSMKSRLPKWPVLVRLFLRSPVKPGGAQMYIVATRDL